MKGQTQSGSAVRRAMGKRLRMAANGMRPAADTSRSSLVKRLVQRRGAVAGKLNSVPAHGRFPMGGTADFESLAGKRDATAIIHAMPAWRANAIALSACFPLASSGIYSPFRNT